MKKFAPIFLGLIFCVCQSSCKKAEGHDMLEQLIREQVGKHHGELSLNDFQAVKVLQLYPGRAGKVELSGKVNDLTLVSKCENVEQLDFGKNKIKDLLPIAGLKSLTKLILPHNQISDVKPLEGMEKLEIIDLSHNQIKDPMPLAKLPKLSYVDLTGNKISPSIIDQLKSSVPKGCEVVFK